MTNNTIYVACCLAIDPSVTTGNTTMDRFFSTQFEASTGMWIRKHPKLDGIARLYRYSQHKGWPIGDGGRLLHLHNQFQSRET